MYHVMDQEVHFCQKFTNMKSPWVKAEESFLPAPLNDSNEVEHFIVEPKSDNVLGNCLKMEDFSSGFDYGIQTNNGGLDSNSKQEGEHDLKFGDLDQLLDDVNEVEGFHESNNLPYSYTQVAENVSGQNRGLCLGNSSSESKSQGSNKSDNDAFGLSELSPKMELESETNDNPVERGLTCESSSRLSTGRKCVTPVGGSIYPTSFDLRNFNRFDTNRSHLENEVLSDENEKGHIGEFASCSRERRSRKPTRRFIEEFSNSKSGAYKGKRKLPMKNKYMKVVTNEEPSRIKHKAQVLIPKEEPICGSSTPVQSRTPRAYLKKHTPISGFLSEDESSAAGSKDLHLSAKRSKAQDRRKHQKMWTLTEVMRLVDGIAEYGTGRWTQIKKHLFASSAYRTPIDLRDKWRNLLRASCVNVPNKKGIEQKQAHASRPLPKSLLQRVNELANIHPYPRERNTKSVEEQETSSPVDFTEIDSSLFNWGRKKNAS